MMNKCLVYKNGNISEIRVYRGHDMVEISANAFLGAPYLEVSWELENGVIVKIMKRSSVP